jgi:glycosyltransferase involved in cell wall biosynthesis
MKDYSLNLTIHNKGFLVPSVLQAFKDRTVGNYEIVVVLDGCSDNSEEEVVKFFKENKDISHKIFYADNVFETKANNIAAKNSDGKYIIIVQDDMIVNEDGWNQRLATPVEKFDDIYAVTARTSYNYILNPNSTHLAMNKEDDLKIDNCWSDIVLTLDHAEKEKGLPRDMLAIRNSVNRGPLLVRHDIFESAGYLNEKFSPQDQDDADLNYRVFKKFGMHCGCYWTDFISDLKWGGTRPDGHNPASWLLKAHHKNTRHLFEDHEDILRNGRIIENRKVR